MSRNVLFITLGAGLSNVASAACPGVFSGASCASVCTNPDAYHVTCDLAVTADDYDTEAHFVSPSHTSFRAYGFDGNNTAFCCEFSGLSDGCSNPGQGTVTVTVNGTTHRDTIDFNDNIAGLSLTCSNDYAYASYEQDSLIGSIDTSTVDHLYGDQDADFMHGNAGDDFLYGGDGIDTMYGDAGADYMQGDAGADHMKGGTGTDTMYGGDDDDYVCGEGDADSLYGDAGENDVLFGGGAVDTINSGGAGGNDNCENDHKDFSCELATVTTCPW